MIFAFNLISYIMVYVKMTLSFLHRQISEFPSSHKSMLKVTIGNKKRER
jgi:hypothetical protein